MDEDLCISIATPIASFLPIKGMLLLQAAMGISAIILSISTIRRYQKVCFHNNCKVGLLSRALVKTSLVTGYPSPHSLYRQWHKPGFYLCETFQEVFKLKREF